MAIESQAKFYLGTTSYATKLPEVDLSLPDPELFEACLHQMALQWSSTGETPHHKSSMAKNGRVARFSQGRYVYVMGNGWSCAYYTPEYIAEMQAAIDAKETDKIVSMVSDAVQWAYEPPAKPTNPAIPRWRK
jgi:hypothetical protein